MKSLNTLTLEKELTEEALDKQVAKLHELIQKYRALNMWGIAEAFEKTLRQILKEMENGQK